LVALSNIVAVAVNHPRALAIAAGVALRPDDYPVVAVGMAEIP
jgi:hypothetical protein